MRSWKCVFMMAALFAAALSAQPSVTLIGNNNGWVPPGSPSYGIAQGAIFAIKGANLGPAATAVRTADGEKVQLHSRGRVRWPFADIKPGPGAGRGTKDALTAAAHGKLAVLIAQPDADHVAVAVAHGKRPSQVRRGPGRTDRF